MNLLSAANGEAK
jgi:predicted acyltransferase